MKKGKVNNGLKICFLVFLSRESASYDGILCAITQVLEDT